MKIVAVSSWMEKIKLTQPYTIAYNSFNSTEIIFLEIVLSNGITGIGSANPFEDVTGESPSATLKNLQDGFLQNIVGKNIEDFKKLITLTTQQYKHYPATIAAVDIALYDAYCKYIQKPLVDFLGRKTGPLATSVTIGIKDITSTIEDATNYYNQGFRIIKLKTGQHCDEDAEKVIKLYENFGAKIKIRVDANEGYTIQQLNNFIQQTSFIPLELIEQPLKAGSEDELLSLQKNLQRKIVADESLTGTEAASRLLVPPVPYSVFNIKLMKCGGIAAAKEIACQAAAIDLFWGCNDESSAGIAAALHTAYSCSNTKYLDLDGCFDLTTDPAQNSFILKDGFLYCNNSPGLGITLKK